MDIRPSKAYLKQYKKLSITQKQAVDDALSLFSTDPHDKKLRNHALIGRLNGIRSIDAAFDLRVWFVEEDGYMIVFLVQVGTHSQLYG